MRYAAKVLLLLVTIAVAFQPVPAWGRPTMPSPSGWPLTGAITVVKEFDPPAQRWGRGHRGVDLAAARGDPVLATAAGTVTFAARLAGRGVVVVDHGRLRTTYEPVTASVAVGDRVVVGDVVGTVSAGSHCRRPCLHWGLKDGDAYLDPMLLGAGAGTLRLMPKSQRALAERRARQRAAAAEEAARRAAAEGVAAPQGFVGASGRGGFRRPVPGGVTSPYGMRFHPVLRVRKLHDGTDFGAGCGTPIRAPAAAVVSRAYFNAGYGKRLMLDHGTVSGRRVVTGYNHASRYVVRPGERVRKGQVIGYVGNTGFSTGCHLHLMVWLNGLVINPMSWF